MYDEIVKQVVETIVGIIAAALIPVVLHWWALLQAKAKSANLEWMFAAAQKIVAAAKQNGMYPTDEAMKAYAVAELEKLGLNASIADAMVEAAVKAMKDAEAASACPVPVVVPVSPAPLPAVAAK